MQTGDDVRVGAAGVVVLRLQDLPAATLQPGEEQQGAALQLLDFRDRHVQRCDRDLAVGLDTQARDSAEGGEVMILLAHRVTGEVHFDMDGQLG